MTLLNYLPEPMQLIVYAVMVVVGIVILKKILGDIK